MSERYVTLIGAEQVQSAANTMVRAAEQMGRAADNINYAFESHQRFLEDWLVRLQATMEQKS
ncbi:hypothetical protein V1279_002967 [Bradyrhizobium sp. AZCC 1610]|jgi:hypothetical protein|uniref:hypothetical protein n=1 Tax=Bradyrhizobium sp. AZCC 1610 TaxID=3117020 RepID=UPI002FF41E95